ncbi:hypothetical protein D3C76_1378830 [compost metagenome]
MGVEHLGTYREHCAGVVTHQQQYRLAGDGGVLEHHHRAVAGRNVLRGELQLDVVGRALGVECHFVLAIGHQAGHHTVAAAVHFGAAAIEQRRAFGALGFDDRPGLALGLAEGHAAGVGDDAAREPHANLAIAIAIAVAGRDVGAGCTVLGVDPAGAAAVLVGAAACAINAVVELVERS